MNDQEARDEQISASFSRHVEEFHGSLPAEEQQLLEMVFSIAEQASNESEVKGYTTSDSAAVLRAFSLIRDLSTKSRTYEKTRYR